MVNEFVVFIEKGDPRENEKWSIYYRNRYRCRENGCCRRLGIRHSTTITIGKGEIQRNGMETSTDRCRDA
jgi:hypothetical protein